MSIAISIKSESGDSYLMSYRCGSIPDQIYQGLLESLDYYRPIADWRVSTDFEEEDVESEMEELMSKLMELSWGDSDE